MAPSDKIKLTLNLKIHPSTPFCLHIFPCKCSLQQAIYCLGLSPLASAASSGLDPHWIRSDILLLPWVMELLQLSICGTGPFTCSSSSYMR